MSSTPPVRSIVAIVCPPVMLSVLYFLTTEQGRSFNERVFGRYYTLGAILMLGAYGVLFVGLFALGITSSLAAVKQREEPLWLPRVALAVNMIPPVAILLYRSYF